MVVPATPPEWIFRGTASISRGRSCFPPCPLSLDAQPKSRGTMDSSAKKMVRAVVRRIHPDLFAVSRAKGANSFPRVTALRSRASTPQYLGGTRPPGRRHSDRDGTRHARPPDLLRSIGGARRQRGARMVPARRPTVSPLLPNPALPAPLPRRPSHTLARRTPSRSRRLTATSRASPATARSRPAAWSSTSRRGTASPRSR